MADQPEFPAPMHHPATGGETTAATRSSLRVLETRGWKRGPKPTDTRAPSTATVTPRTTATAATAPSTPPDSDEN